MTIDEESKLVDYLTKHSIKDIYYKNAYLNAIIYGLSYWRSISSK